MIHEFQITLQRIDIELKKNFILCEILIFKGKICLEH
jgi:hypothetical protein